MLCVGCTQRWGGGLPSALAAAGSPRRHPPPVHPRHLGENENYVWYRAPEARPRATPRCVGCEPRGGSGLARTTLLLPGSLPAWSPRRCPSPRRSCWAGCSRSSRRAGNWAATATGGQAPRRHKRVVRCAPACTVQVEGAQRPNLKSEDSGFRHRFSGAKVSLWMYETISIIRTCCT